VNAKVEESQGSVLDTAIWIAAVLILVGGIYAFYHFSAQPGWQRALGMIAVFGISGYVASLSLRGKSMISFLMEARNEVRKVVWRQLKLARQVDDQLPDGGPQRSSQSGVANAPRDPANNAGGHGRRSDC